MTRIEEKAIIQEYLSYLDNKDFPCIAAKAALAKQHINCMVVDHMACPKDDYAILQFLYRFIDEYRNADDFFHSAAIIFKEPVAVTEPLFDQLLWQRLQSLTNMDAQQYTFDKRVSGDPASPQFSFSLKEEALFIIGLHPASSREARRFAYPTLAFNPHAQFEQLRQDNRYNKIKKIVRKRDTAYSGSVNPMLADFGEASEVYQYSGINYNNNWQCPLKINHATTGDHSAT
jgi:FPC/CPF motif-containing protein YcgG